MDYKIYQSSHNTLFGDLTQCRLIMERNFGGTHFKVPSSPGGKLPVIDVMFFPATFGEEVTLDPHLNNKESIGGLLAAEIDSSLYLN